MINNINNTTEQPAQRPWYCYPQLWLVIALPLSAVIGGLATVYIAHKNPPIVIKQEHRFHLNHPQKDD